MSRTIEHIHWPDAPGYVDALRPCHQSDRRYPRPFGGSHRCTGVSSSPSPAGEFDSMATDMGGQTREALENLKKGLDAVGATFEDIVTASRYVTDLSDQDSMNEVWAEYFGDAKPATTTVQVVQLATDPRCMIEINAIAVV